MRKGNCYCTMLIYLSSLSHNVNIPLFPYLTSAIVYHIFYFLPTFSHVVHNSFTHHHHHLYGMKCILALLTPPLPLNIPVLNAPRHQHLFWTIHVLAVRANHFGPSTFLPNNQFISSLFLFSSWSSGDSTTPRDGAIGSLSVLVSQL